jgi:hypothetical protein
MLNAKDFSETVGANYARVGGVNAYFESAEFSGSQESTRQKSAN